MRRVLASIGFLMLAGCAAHPPLPVAEGVALEKYAGTWYEHARLPNRFQDNCAGDVRAEYALAPDRTLLVTNQCRTREGTINVAQGQGRLAKGGAPSAARLEVRFAPAWLSWLPWVWGDYWILRLEGDYQHSLVGTPDRRFLWVLSRSAKADEAVLRELLDHARGLGFDVARVVRTN